MYMLAYTGGIITNIYIYICIYINIYRERDKDIDICIYMHTYMYMPVVLYHRWSYNAVGVIVQLVL